MNRFERAFNGKKHVFLVAVHVSTDQDAVEGDVEVAYEEGADGIIVIRDYKSLATDDDVLAAYDAARAAYPKWWIGVNLLQHSAIDATGAIRHDSDGLWFDDAQIDEARGDARFLKRIKDFRDGVRYRTMLLPSVAFKYQSRVQDVARVAKLAEPYADVIITSGDATGVPADFEKVRKMREAVACPLGLASGVSVDNLRQFIDLGVNVFIVNTSISTPKPGSILDPDKVRALRAEIPR